MAKKKAASSSKGASRKGTRLRDDDKPELRPSKFSITSGQTFSARLLDDGISASDVLELSVVPIEGAPPFTVEGLDRFKQSSLPDLAPDRTRVTSTYALKITWGTGVSRADRSRGISTGKLKITIRPAGSTAADDGDLYEYDDIEVYIDD